MRLVDLHLSADLYRSRLFSPLRACHRPLARSFAQVFRNFFGARAPNIYLKKKSGTSRSVYRQIFSPVRRLQLDKTPKNRNAKNRKNGELRTAVYPPRMAPFVLKLSQDAFQTIPNISYFDSEQLFSGREGRCTLCEGWGDGGRPRPRPRHTALSLPARKHFSQVRLHALRGRLRRQL